MLVRSSTDEPHAQVILFFTLEIRLTKLHSWPLTCLVAQVGLKLMVFVLQLPDDCNDIVHLHTQMAGMTVCICTLRWLNTQVAGMTVSTSTLGPVSALILDT